MRKADEIIRRIADLEESVERAFCTMATTIRDTSERWQKKLEELAFEAEKERIRDRKEIDSLQEENERLRAQIRSLTSREDQFNNLMTYNGRPQQ